MTDIASPTSARSLRLAVLMVVLVAATAAVGQFATASSVATWYPTLAKPGFNPPSWVFAPAWTILYVLMAYAGWRILRLPSGTPGRAFALTLFFLQLALNAAWSWMFFGLQNPAAGLVNIIPQFLLIVATLAAFSRLDVAARLCMVPLAAWVAFASLLNFEIWRLNG